MKDPLEVADRLATLLAERKAFMSRANAPPKTRNVVARDRREARIMQDAVDTLRQLAPPGGEDGVQVDPRPDP